MRKEIQLVKSAIESTGILYTYNTWPLDENGKIVKPKKPYASLEVTRTYPVLDADDEMCQRAYSMTLDYWSPTKDIDGEELVGKALESIGAHYESEERYDDSSKIYQIHYTFELFEDIDV